ncbi:MAG TPA: hypothetical protein VFP04_06115, partial [Nitrospira sp.]|nr:hypothetical protein [Nitrospira sp.]
EHTAFPASQRRSHHGNSKTTRPAMRLGQPLLQCPSPAVAENEHENQPLDIKIGKMIFYATVALGLWFFYWFNGIQCPC